MKMDDPSDLVARPAVPVRSPGAPELGSLTQVGGHLARRLSNAFTAAWDKDFVAEQVQITPVQGGILLVIAHNPGITQAQVAELMAVEGPTLVQSMARLADYGLIDKERRADDRRAVALSLSRKGWRLLPEVEARVRASEDRVLAPLSPDDRARLLSVLSRLLFPSDGA